jgi:hypothetical protein
MGSCECGMCSLQSTDVPEEYKTSTFRVEEYAQQEISVKTGRKQSSSKC